MEDLFLPCHVFQNISLLTIHYVHGIMWALQHARDMPETAFPLMSLTVEGEAGVGVREEYWKQTDNLSTSVQSVL